MHQSSPIVICKHGGVGVGMHVGYVVLITTPTKNFFKRTLGTDLALD